ncbi:DUF3794 domain-containing protein [Virgibacillus profundi]|uniref:DUF3794 domain-containing protein n=1 Tax=Virgibacillus profundi TaxID=2024555 RepID=A0A2A2IHF2_9BACI|nr:DUF3794 domain-containing protein [Virgibacillus profundi]PAV30533.1 DUF3794 domain-containing protein [Virgibacillus profundi]PXY54705.1 DUF3794 domain-containing protein [Virgibacillus profundi]
MSKNENQNNCVNVNQSASLEQCTNAPTDLPFFTGTRRIRVPVNLGEFVVTSHLSANITFPDPVLEIKDVKKRVEIVQCRLMTNATTAITGASTGPFPLFIRGFVRKNIQYASPCFNSSGECVSSEMKSFTTRVPFECMTTVTLDVPARLPELNERAEFDFAITKDLGAGYPEKDHFHSSDISQFHQQSEQAYNDLPFCELVRNNIIEWDEATDRETFEDGPVGEGFFQNIVEKMTLNFTIRVLQVQNLQVTG